MSQDTVRESPSEDSYRRNLENLLLHPREDLEVEFKDWLDLSDPLHKANLAQAMLAMANHGGGTIILGFRDGEDAKLIEKAPPEDFNPRLYSSDSIVGIVKRYADPVINIEVRMIRHPESSVEHPVITVLGGYTTPIRSKRHGPEEKHVSMNKYYIRSAGPASKSAESAEEWNSLISQCVRNNRQNLLDDFRRIMRGEVHEVEDVKSGTHTKLQEWLDSSLQMFRTNHASELPQANQEELTKSFSAAAYALEGDFQLDDLSILRRILLGVQRDEPGGPYWWVDLSGKRPGPRPFDNNQTLVYWRDVISDAFGKYFNYEFWRASTEAMMFLLRGYDEDVRPSGTTPGEMLREIGPIWDAAICLSHSVRMAKALGDQNTIIHFALVWEGLKGRELETSMTRQPSTGPPVCFQQTVRTAAFSFGIQDIESALPEAVMKVTEPLFTAFSLYRSKTATIERQIKDLRNHVHRLWDP